VGRPVDRGTGRLAAQVAAEWPPKGQPPRPFAVPILGQTCHTCQDEIPPGATGWRCADGWVRCGRHAARDGGAPA
jgi:hypothetical protein